MSGLRTESSWLLLPRIAKGDPAAAALCVERWGDRLGALVSRCGLAGEAGVRALREIFASVWARAGEWQPGREAEFLFVLRVARRWLLDHRGETCAADPEPAAAAGEPAVRQGDLFGEPARVARALRSLDAREREVLELAILRALPYARIAQRLAAGPDEVRAAARRGLLRVRELMHAEATGRGGASLHVRRVERGHGVPEEIGFEDASADEVRPS